MRSAGRISLAMLACALVAALSPALASAASYEVDSAANEPDNEIGVGGCSSAAGKCTFRAAVEESNNSVGVRDEIVFSPTVFEGQLADTIDISGGFTTIADPVTIDGGQCQTGAGAAGPCAAVDGAPGLDIAADDVVIEGLAVTGAQTAIDVAPTSEEFEAIDNWVGRELDGDPRPNQNDIVTSGDKSGLVGNLIEGGVFGITFNGSANGGLVEGNTLRNTSNHSIQLAGSENRVLGNVIEEAGFSSIFLTGAATGNQIGGDTPASENVSVGSMFSPIALVVGETTQNEVARNRGSENGGGFILISKFVSADPNFPNGGIKPPPIASALQSSAAGTAEPGATVRVFRKATDAPGEIASFLGAATADGSGIWTVKYPGQVPVGTNLAATQTNPLGGTSELAFAVASADPPPTCNDTPAPQMCVLPPPPPPPADTTKPKVTIKSGPKAKSTATTAKFKFVSNEAGSTFKCKLDKRAFANCRSPKAYKKLKPDVHVFKVKATDAAGNVSAVLTRKFTVLE